MNNDFVKAVTTRGSLHITKISIYIIIIIKTIVLVVHK